MSSSCAGLRAAKCGALLIGTALGLTTVAARAQDAPASGSRTAASAARHVDINEYYVQGNTRLSDPEIEQAVYPYLGPDKTLDDVEQARVALQKAYEAKGLKTVFVEIPQQNVVGGRVVLQVTEAKIGQVAMSGEKHTSEKRVMAALPDIRPGQVPNLNRLTDEITTLNGRSADRQVTPQLKAGAQPGTIDVDLTVDDKWPFHGGIQLNNQYSRDTTALRLQANARYDDLWGLGHSISAFYSVAPERRSDAEVFVGSYGIPLSDTLRLDITGLVSNSDVNTVGSTNVLGDGHSVTAVLTRTLPSSAKLFHRVTLSLAYKDFKEDDSIVDATTGAASISRAPVTYFPVALGYAGTVTLPKGNLGFDLTGTFAFRGLGSSSTAFDNKRFRASGGFAVLHADLNYLYTLPWDAQLYLSLTGQLSSEPLISNEQIAAGGEGTVRGYLQSEAIGDQGYVSSIELRSPNVAHVFGHGVEEIRAHVFVDAGHLSIKDALPDQTASQNLPSIGTGLSLKLLGHLSGSIDIALPLRKGDITHSGDPRLHFSIASDF